MNCNSKNKCHTLLRIIISEHFNFMDNRCNSFSIRRTTCMINHDILQVIKKKYAWRTRNKNSILVIKHEACKASAEPYCFHMY